MCQAAGLLSGTSSVSPQRTNVPKAKVVTILPVASEIMQTISEWREEALAGELWNHSFWTTVSALQPDLQDDEPSRQRIVKDFEAIHRILAFPFACDQSEHIMHGGFERIMERIRSLQVEVWIYKLVDFEIYNQTPAFRAFALLIMSYN